MGAVGRRARFRPAGSAGPIVPGPACRAGGRDHAGRRTPGLPAAAGVGPGLALLRAGVFCHAGRAVRPRRRNPARLRGGGCPRGCGSPPGSELRRRPFQRPPRRRRPGYDGPPRRRSARRRDRRRCGRRPAGRGARERRRRRDRRRGRNAGGRADIARRSCNVQRLRPRFRGRRPRGCRGVPCGSACRCVPRGCVFGRGHVSRGCIFRGRAAGDFVPRDLVPRDLVLGSCVISGGVL